MARPPAAGDRPRALLVAGAVALLGALLSTLAVIRPWEAAPLGFDAQATVLYFDRLAAGARLEQPLTTTPKPLLTFAYGLLHSATGDWRTIVWLTVVVHAVGAGLVAVFVGRAAGALAGLAAGLVVGGSAILLEEAAVGSGLPWGLAGWAGAGVAATGEHRRPVLAGVLLLLAALARIETLVLVAVEVGALAWARFGPLPSRIARPSVEPGTWAIVAIPWLALPVMAIHDALLTGDPFYWATVSVRYSENLAAGGGTIFDPIERTGWLVRRYLEAWPLHLLGAVAVVALALRGRWAMVVGLAGLGPGIAAFLVALAARGIYAPDRYAAPIDLSVAVAAVVGVAVLAGGVVDRLVAGGRLAVVRSAHGVLAAASVALAVVVAAGLRLGPFDPSAAAFIASLRATNANAAAVTPTLAAAADPRAGGARWFVPVPVLPRLAVDLDASLDEVRALGAAQLAPGTAAFVPGQVVYHDRGADRPAGAFAALETADPTRLGDVILEPVLTDPAAGVWVFVVGAVP